MLPKLLIMIKRSFCILFLVVSFNSFAQKLDKLTVEKIMRDPKWMGTSPSNPYWSADSKSVLFNWNPAGNISDSVFGYTVSGGEPQKVDYLDAQKATAMSNGIYNSNYSQLAYVYRGDLYLLDTRSGKTTRITQTEEAETAPKFILQNEWLVYTR